MIKKLIYLIIPILFFSFSQNVKAYSESEYYYFNDIEGDSTQYYSLKSEIDYFLINDDNPSLQNYLTIAKANKLYTKFKNGDYSSYGEYAFIIMQEGTGAKLVVFNSLDDIYLSKSTGTLNVNLKNCTLISGSSSTGNQSSISTKTNYSVITFNPTSDPNVYEYMYNYLESEYNKIHFTYLSNMEMYDRIFKNFNNLKPELSYSLEPIYKDGYISSYGIKVNSSLVDDTLYKYQYEIKDDINNNLKWVDLYNNNFINNQFSYVTKKPIYFYFRILDKSNNEVIDSINITVTFNFVSPQYEIIFNQSKFYLNGTNYIDRVGISITYKTSVDGLKYQYQYVNDGNTIIENNWVDTESDIYKVYNVNGVLYARILDNNNNVLYNHSFTNTLIGTQDILENPTNFPLYNKVQSILNFNKGSISDLVLIPVKVLMFMTDSLNSNVCNEYSFGSLLGHELKLPCIDIKSYVGNTIYNFYDLVCSFFISLGIIKLLKNIYMRFMTLEIRDIDNKGGIF